MIAIHLLTELNGLLDEATLTIKRKLNAQEAHRVWIICLGRSFLCLYRNLIYES